MESDSELHNMTTYRRTHCLDYDMLLLQSCFEVEMLQVRVRVRGRKSQTSGESRTVKKLSY